MLLYKEKAFRKLKQWTAFGKQRITIH